MASRIPTPDGVPPRAGDPPEPTAPPPGPFIGIGLPQGLAALLAGQRPLLMLPPEAIPTAGLHETEDAVVGCMLLGNTVDALDIIADLGKAGFRGSVTVISPPLPNPRMVELELSRAARPMTVRLVVL